MEDHPSKDTEKVRKAKTVLTTILADLEEDSDEPPPLVGESADDQEEMVRPPPGLDSEGRRRRRIATTTESKLYFLLLPSLFLRLAPRDLQLKLKLGLPWQRTLAERRVQGRSPLPS